MKESGKKDITLSAGETHDKSRHRHRAEAGQIDLQQHWDKVFADSPEDKLGWYERDVSPTLLLVGRAGVDKAARILIAGAGSTTLVDALLAEGYSGLLATDISQVALANLRARLGDSKQGNLQLIVDDLTKPVRLASSGPVDLWIDRAVLHFFTAEEDRQAYFCLLKKLLRQGGYVILAQFSLAGAAKCSGLPVHRYSKEMLADELGSDFKLIDSFGHTYTMPSGGLRPYVYALFKRA